jgi:hypothetical protein
VSKDLGESAHFEIPVDAVDFFQLAHAVDDFQPIAQIVVLWRLPCLHIVFG